MVVLSLFDGISCGQVALERAGIAISEYHASEIDKFAIQITQKHFPNTKQIGNVKELDVTGKHYDLLIGGSPCQNLSRAVINDENHNQGLDGENSSLFYDYVRILRQLKETNPHIRFMLENVESMSQKDKEIISETLGVEPIEINSSLFSAQDRKRYYWTNISVPELPEDSPLVMKDIMEPAEDVTEKEGRMKFWYDCNFTRTENSGRLVATLDINGHDILKRVYSKEHKSPTLTTCGGGNTQAKVMQDGKPRKLTPLEYERLQTLPDNYTSSVSNSQRYKTIGNGWTVDVIAHILKGIKE